jgi:hypothetical protein
VAVEVGGNAVFRLVTQEEREKERRRADALSRRDPDAAAAMPRYLTAARASYAPDDTNTPAAAPDRSPLQLVRGSHGNNNHRRQSRASGRELIFGNERGGGGGGGGEQAALPLEKYEPDFGRRAAPQHDAGAAVGVARRVGR